MTLRKILEAFKISSIITMKLKAAISFSKVRFKKICINYSLKIMQLFKNHSIRLRVSTSFPPYNNKNELDWEKYFDWNENNQNNISEIAELDSEFNQEQRHRKKRRKIKKKKKKIVS